MSSFLQDTGDHSIDRPMAVEKTILIWYNNKEVIKWPFI